MSIIIILAEVSLILVLLSLVNWLVGVIFQQLMKVSWLKQGSQTLRQNIRGILILSGIVLSLTVIGVNGWLLYRGEDLTQYTLTLIRGIPVQFWVTLGLGIIKSISLLILAGIVLRLCLHGDIGDPASGTDRPTRQLCHTGTVAFNRLKIN
ncbi:MAG: hypothetical protein RIE73_07470 [Coleofasciculus sp. C1-SOL-03]|uniref:hypothetical protein n=1 Tax=Coleofasciculus sp. C1-SOL-03 TaxID=3069522 RepID=UPI003301B7D0